MWSQTRPSAHLIHLRGDTMQQMKSRSNTGVMLSKTAKRRPRFGRARRLPGDAGGPKSQVPNGFPPGAIMSRVQTEGSLKAVPRWRHWILPQQCAR